MTELSACYLSISCAGVVLHTDWPRHPIVHKRVFPSGPCPGNHVQGASEATIGDNNHQNRYEHHLPTTGENLCDRVCRIWSPDTRPNKEIPVGRHPLDKIPNIAHVISQTSPVLVPWTCGHWRCLLYMLLRVLVRALLYPVVAVDFGLAAWLLHNNTQVVLVRISHILLAERIVNDLLTLTWLSAVVVLASKALYIALMVFVPWIFRTSSCLQPANLRFSNLLRGVPSSLKPVGRTGVFFVSIFISWSIAQVLMKRDPILTESILSYSIELLMMPRIALSAYRRLFTPKKPTAQKYDASRSHRDPELAPGDLSPTGKTDEVEHEDGDKDGAEVRKERLLSMLAKFRLAILLPNAAIWIFHWWLMSAASSGP